MSYEYNDDVAEILIQPELWEDSKDILFLQKQVNILQHRKTCVPKGESYRSMILHLDNGVQVLMSLIDRLTERQSKGYNQFM